MRLDYSRHSDKWQGVLGLSSGQSARESAAFWSPFAVCFAIYSLNAIGQGGEGRMMFSASKQREKDGFQMTGAADAVYSVRKGFYGSKRFIQGIRPHLELPLLRGIQRLSRRVLPSIAKNGRSIAIRFGAVAMEIQKSSIKSDFRSYTKARRRPLWPPL